MKDVTFLSFEGQRFERVDGEQVGLEEYNILVVFATITVVRASGLPCFCLVCDAAQNQSTRGRVAIVLAAG